MSRLKKGENIKGVKIVSIAHKGQTIGKMPNGMVVLVDDAVPGDIVTVQLKRKRKGLWNGYAIEIEKESGDRTDPKCQHFEDCGGCKWQHLSYAAQIANKQSTVEDAMRRIAKIDTPVLPILGSERIYQYRNKLEFSAGATRWVSKSQAQQNSAVEKKDGIGFHPPGFYNKVVHVEQCWLQDNLSNEIRNFIYHYAKKVGWSFFEPNEHSGFLRSVVVRNSTIGEWLVIVVFHYDADSIQPFLNNLLEQFPQISSLFYVINNRKNDSLFQLRPILHAGQPYLTEKIGNINYRIGPLSFFQTNPYQAETLYQQVKLLAELKHTDVVYDLYTGLGSIALYIAEECKTVIGIEEVEEAIHYANENKVVNNISNAQFFVGDVKNELGDDQLKRFGSPDVIIVDPPRAGLHGSVIERIIELSPRRIVYVSCNPSTQARDIDLFNLYYTVTTLQPVDMFPHTNHIENIAVLDWKEMNNS